MRLYGDISKTGAGRGDDCSTGYLLDYQYIKENQEITTIDLRK